MHIAPNNGGVARMPQRLLYRNPRRIVGPRRLTSVARCVAIMRGLSLSGRACQLFTQGPLFSKLACPLIILIGRRRRRPTALSRAPATPRGGRQDFLVTPRFRVW